VSRICTNVRTRRNIYCLSESHPDVIAYRAGVAAMKALPSSDPTSWEAQRALHGTTVSSPPTPIFNKCEHGTLFFLSWHRMYLYWFERIVRAKSGNPAFALPYWGYSPVGVRNLPVHFRVPASSSNVLYTSNRNAASNAGTNMNASLVDPGLALLETLFYDFQGLLESTPHDDVHVPGVQGWMGWVPTAALDPIFYLHHCNIDRLWGIWLAQGGGRVNPSDWPWLNNVYQFYDENGATVDMTGAQIVHTANQLCYKYASPKCLIAVDVDAEPEPTQIKALDSRAASVADPIGSRPPRTSPYTLAEEQVSVKLGGAPVTVTVPIPAGTRDELRGFSEAREGNRLALLLQDLVLEREPALYYEIYVNLPGDPAAAEYTSPHYAGNLSFFSLTMPGGHGGHSRRVNLLRTYAYLRSRDQWSDEEVRVTFVPRGGFEGDDPAKLVAGVQVTIGRITLQIQ
jgi:tyrosinase